MPPCSPYVVANNRLSAEAGVAMLRAGGNAVDAALAASLMEDVVSPSSCGIGGYGGALVFWRARQRTAVALNFNSPAPRAFTGSEQPARHGALAIGVPGVLRGFETASRKFGRLKWAQLLAPAIERAEAGLVVGAGLANSLRTLAPTMAKYPGTAAIFLPNHRPPTAGETLYFPELAQSLRLLAREGADAFYRGALARTIVGYLRSQGSPLTLEEWGVYTPRQSAPLRSAFREFTLHTPDLPSGGITVLQCLRVLEQLTLPDQPEVEFYHAFIQTLKLVWRDRLTQLGDSTKARVPVRRLLSDEHARGLAKLIQEHRIPREFDRLNDRSCTTHVCAADADGNLVALTHTHGDGFGSLVTAPGTGILLGHGMSRFDAAPGRPNSIGPGKQPLHNMSPLLITRGREPIAVLGLPGGTRIPNAVAAMTLQLLHFRAGLTEAIATPRVHTEGAEPIQVERRMPEALVEALRSRGHEVRRMAALGGAASIIARDPKTGQWSAVADPRGVGVALAP